MIFLKHPLPHACGIVPHARLQLLHWVLEVVRPIISAPASKRAIDECCRVPDQARIEEVGQALMWRAEEGAQGLAQLRLTRRRRGRGTGACTGGAWSITSSVIDCWYGLFRQGPPRADSAQARSKHFRLVLRSRPLSVVFQSCVLFQKPEGIDFACERGCSRPCP